MSPQSHADRLWQPTDQQVADAQVTKFRQQIEQRHGIAFEDFHRFYDWSVTSPEAFWEAVWDFFAPIASQQYSSVLTDGHLMPGARWFDGARLNFAENLLRYRDDHPAIVFWGEDKVQRRLTYSELYQQVARLAPRLREMGVGPGERVAGLMPNMPEAIIVMLATASLGAVWSSCSPDFGPSGVVDRFGQIDPKVLVTVGGYFYKGQIFDCRDKIARALQSIPSVEHVIFCRYAATESDSSEHLPSRAQLHDYQDLVAAGGPSLDFEQVPFDHPLYVMFSSGTTGRPKCIVHGVGGTLLEHLKEHVLHTDLRREDKIFYATTCGWVMWNWLASSLAVGSTVLLYDGAPSVREMQILFDLVDEEEMTVFGTSAAFITSLKKAGLRPRETHRLDSLRAMLSTGSTLAPENFDYVYQHVKNDLMLASISGGTDIIGCFALGCPVLPVHRGELQTRSLGYAVDVFGENGESLQGKKGELVCRKPFPSMPIGFWKDREDVKYREAYFSHFENVWRHGDYVMLTEQQGMVFFGRSDAVLNPRGVRIGTAEIYRQLEQIDEVIGSVVVGQQWKGDVRIVLFVQLRADCCLDGELKEKIRSLIRQHTTPRHVPKKIVAVRDIPVTRSGKISELAVRNVIHGDPVSNTEALANPESLQEFRDLAELGC